MHARARRHAPQPPAALAGVPKELSPQPLPHGFAPGAVPRPQAPRRRLPRPQLGLEALAPRRLDAEEADGELCNHFFWGGGRIHQSPTTGCYGLHDPLTDCLSGLAD